MLEVLDQFFDRLRREIRRVSGPESYGTSNALAWPGTNLPLRRIEGARWITIFAGNADVTVETSIGGSEIVTSTVPKGTIAYWPTSDIIYYRFSSALPFTLHGRSRDWLGDSNVR